jgi:hypothetical protein
MKWLMELIKTLIAYFSVETKKANSPIVGEFTEFLGDKALKIGGVKGALAGLGAEFGGAVITEAIDFVQNHHSTLFSMTKKELSFVFSGFGKYGGKFDEKVYKEFVDGLDEELLIAEAEANARAMEKVAGRVAAKRAMIEDLKHTTSVLARFALSKAISIASHGIL